MKITKRKILALILTPFVFLGLYFAVYKNRVNETHADDPLTISYHGDTTSTPVFTVVNMLPGDEKEEEINVKNNGTTALAIAARFEKTEELKEFADILDVEVEHNASDLFSGKLENLFTQGNLILFTLIGNEDKTFRIKVKFPSGAGNEYQEAKVVFDIIFATEITIELPPECQHMAGLITEVVEGTEGNDNLHSGITNDLILAKGGDDRVDASSGSDCVIGGGGNDKLFSESGNDTVVGGPGNDRIDSGSGSDKVYGGEGNDNIDTGSGEDQIYGNEGQDNIDAGSGDDIVYGGGGNDVLRGRSDDDMLEGECGNDTIQGNSGNDILDGGPDTDNLNGNSGTDACTTGETLTSCEL